MVTVPGAIAVTKPAALIVAMLLLLELQFLVLLVEFAGVSVDVSVWVPPAVSDNDEGAIVTPDADVYTVTTDVADLPPSTHLAVIVAFPGAIAVTLPSLLTEATAALLELQVTFLFVAVVGLTVATID